MGDNDTVQFALAASGPCLQLGSVTAACKRSGGLSVHSQLSESPGGLRGSQRSRFKCLFEPVAPVLNQSAAGPRTLFHLVLCCSSLRGAAALAAAFAVGCGFIWN